MKRPALILCFLVLGVFICGSILTPSTWKWDANNLQVKLHNVGNERRNEGSFANSGGWSKLSFFTGDWWRRIGPSTSTGGGVTIKDTTNYHIAGVSPKGVSVRVQFKQERNGIPTSFDQLIFIPTHGIARVDVSPDIYLTGSFD